MNVDNRNFQEALHIIQDKRLIEQSKLISFDLEFSGLKFSNFQQQKYYELPQQRYLKMKQVVTNYSIIEVGLTFFIEKSENQIIAYPFTFYVFPRQSQISNPKISLQASAISFLNQQGMDWNRWIQNGITYAQNTQIEKFRSKNPLLSQHQQINIFGFSLLFEKIWNAQKKLVGHNMLFDLMYIYSSFIDILPANLNEFKAKLQSSKNIFMDTKTLCDEFQDEGFRYAKNTNLKALKQYFNFSKFSFPQKISVADGFIQYGFKTQNLHDAGYQSLITGFIYIRMGKFITRNKIIENEGVIHMTRSYYSLNISDQDIIRSHNRVLILNTNEDISLVISSFRKYLMKAGLGNNYFIQTYQKYVFINAISKSTYEQMKKQVPKFVQLNKSLIKLRLFKLQDYYSKKRIQITLEQRPDITYIQV